LTANDKAKNKTRNEKNKKSWKNVERKQRPEKDAPPKREESRSLGGGERQKGENKNKALDLSFLTYKWRNKSLDIVLNDAHTHTHTHTHTHICMCVHTYTNS